MTEANPEVGGRNPAGLSGLFVTFVLASWVLFQVWIASPLPFSLGVFIINETQARSIHLAFAVFLTFLLFPSRRKSKPDVDKTKRIPWFDWGIAVLGALSAGYLFLAYEGMTERPGLPTPTDKIVAIAGLPILLLATWRALGPALAIVSILFLGYAFAGPYFPDALAHGGASLNKAVSHFWMGTEGVFGVPLGVSTTMVFLFVLFGAILERIGAGNYFIRSAFALLGHLRGGPAKAAVVSSAATGMVSGSSIANVVTTGTFTIPLMRKVGFPAKKAGAIECASSTNGQLTPPVMGAAAFLMVEYVGVTYLEVIRAAALPALLAYIALFYIVHIESVKLGIGALGGGEGQFWRRSLVGGGAVVGGFLGAGSLSYVLINWMQNTVGEGALPWIISLVVSVYVLLVAIAARVPDLAETTELDNIPEMGPTLSAGLYYFVPIGVLVWCFAVEQFSPGLSAFWATVVLGVVALTHHPLKAFLRRWMGRGDLAKPGSDLSKGFRELTEGSLSGARNMIGIGVATAAAGIVVGTVTLTGLGLRMTEFIEFISGGNLILVLMFTAAICLILGMGLPTTANYIVVSSLMAPVIVQLGGDAGLAIPLIAVHLFVFYFGILADDTPPVGLAAYAASAISRGNPISTGVQAFFYDIRTAVLPFLFLFNHELLLIGVDSLPHLFLTISGALAGMLVFASVTQRYFLGRIGWGKVALLGVSAFVFFRPGYLLDQWSDPYTVLPGSEVETAILAMEPGDPLKLRVVGDTLGPVDEWHNLTVPVGETATERLRALGIVGGIEGDIYRIESVPFGTQAFDRGFLFDWTVAELREPNDRPAKEWFWIPAAVLVALIGWIQIRANRATCEG